MKTIIMWQTLELICKEQQDFNNLISQGFQIKRTEELQYLIKQNEEL